MIEDQNAEFKREYTDKLLKSVVAFCNTSGGKIVIGVDDDGNIIGLEDPDDTAKKCVNALSDRIRPDITLFTEVTIHQYSDKSIVTIEVVEGDKKPYYLREKGLCAEGVYVRRGTSSIPVTDEELIKMIRDIRSLTFEDQISFNQELTFNELRSIFERNGTNLDDNHMEILHLKDGERFTNLAFILSDQYDQSIKMASFDDDFRTHFIERAETEGCILKQMEDALAFMRRYNNPSSRIEGMRRIDKYPYSDESLREAMMNAVAHRDYSMSAPILLSIYPDKMTITSPGGMKDFYSMEEMLRGVSSLRNRNLAAIMYRLRMIEAYGTGIPRIFGSYAASSVEPKIENGVSSFSITLPSMMQEDSGPELKGFLDGRDVFTRADLQDALGGSKSEATSMISNSPRD